MPSRKLLFYTHAMTGGGAERVFALLASGFARRGYDVVMAVDYTAPENAAFLDPRVRLRPLGRGHAGSTLALARLLHAEKPDVSLSALGVSNLKHTLAALSVLRHRRAVLTYHGSPIDEPGGLSRLGNNLTPFTSRLTARSVCVSDGLMAEFLENVAGSQSRVRRIYNPVVTDTAIPARSAAELMAREPLILAAGRLVPQKGYHQLLHALNGLDPAGGAKLVILGDGPQRPDLEAQVARLGLQDRVSFPGYVAEPWAYYRQARVLALPSRTEAFGNVVVEALAHGVRVVATDCIGPSEILDGGRFGRLVPRSDLRALTQALAEALSDMSDPLPGVARAQEFSEDRALDLYAALVEEIVAETGG